MCTHFLGNSHPKHPMGGQIHHPSERDAPRGVCDPQGTSAGSVYRNYQEILVALGTHQSGMCVGTTDHLHPASPPLLSYISRMNTVLGCVDRSQGHSHHSALPSHQRTLHNQRQENARMSKRCPNNRGTGWRASALPGTLGACKRCTDSFLAYFPIPYLQSAFLSARPRCNRPNHVFSLQLFV